MGRVSRGIRLVGASWQLLKADPELMLLPLLCLLWTLAAAGAAFGLAWLLRLPYAEDPGSWGAFGMVGGLLFYFAAWVIGVFFQAAIVTGAMIRIREERNPTLGDELRGARAHLGKLARWAILNASIGLLLRAIADRLPWLGQIVVSIVGAAWSAVTYFVVPVLLFEPHDVRASVRRSAELFRRRWGEELVGEGAIGIGVFVLSLPLLALAAGLWLVTPVLGIVAGAIGYAFLASAGSAMSGIFNTVLYEYTATGFVPEPFTNDDVEGAFRPKRRALF